MYCEAAIYSFEAIIGIPQFFIIILSTLTDKQQRLMKSILSLFSVLLSPQPFFFLLWNASKPYFLCSVPICKLVGAAIGATE